MVALLVGVVGMALLIVALNIIDARLDRIERDGQSISAEVVATEGRGEGRTITIEFRSSAGARTEVVRLDGGSPDYEVGQRLDLKVIGTDPAEFVVPGEQNLSPRTSSILSLLTAVALTALCTGLPLLGSSWWLGRRGRSRSARAPLCQPDARQFQLLIR